MYKKRAGTSGIRGQLYETKLLSLLLFKALHKDSIENFYLGTNIDDIGVFSDICFKAKIKGHSRPVAVCIQAKHRENDDKVLTLDNKNNLAKYFESFLKIRTKFNLNSKDQTHTNTDKFFSGSFNNNECLFVLYTTEKANFSNNFEGGFANILNDLIATGPLGTQQSYSNEDVEFLCKIAIKAEIEMLASRFIKFIYNKNIDMNDDLILRYHVILAQNVINVSDIQPTGHRIGTFRLDFFNTKDDYLMLFKDKINQEVLTMYVNMKKNKNPETTEDLLSSFFKDPSEITLADLFLENIVTYKNGRLGFVNEIPVNRLEKLKKIKLPKSKLDLAISWAVKNILKSLQFQLPVEFGNKDLTTNNHKIKYLTNKLLEIIENSPVNNVITIDKSNVDDEFLQLNGGLGSAVGNILLYDRNTKLLKFTDTVNSLEKYSESVLLKLKSKISNLEKYRFNVRDKDFPKLSFDSNKQELVEEFFSKLVFYTEQENESGVGKVLKQEIEEYEGADAKSFQVKTDAIFLHFHEEIQKWWIKQNQQQYLTKTCDLYEIAKNNIMNDPTVSVISMMYMSEIINTKYTFKTTATISLSQSVNQLGRSIIVTDITRLTFIKLIQCLKIKDYVVLDLKYMLNLQTSDFRSLTAELKKMNKEKNIIIICDNLQNITSNLQRNLQDIARAVSDKNIIAITNKMYLEIIMKYFRQATLMNDEDISLFDLDQESQINIIKKAKVIFQGQEVTLDLFIDEVSVAFVKGAILNKILLKEPITIGDSLEFLRQRSFELTHYNATHLKHDAKDLYIERRVRLNKRKSESGSILLQTVYDIKDDVVLITAKPGMGKSTLLSYLYIKTKELNTKLWLIRINLLDYSKHFNKWKKNKTIIDIIEVVKFVCQVVLKTQSVKTNDVIISLSDINGQVYLEQSDDEYTFQLKMFLHFFNSGNVLFLIEGFDEICPNYENEVISFLNVVKNCPQSLKIWITSRPYDRIKYILQQNFSITHPYELEPFSDIDQEIYFENFWKYNFALNELNEMQLENLKQFINFMLKRQDNVFVDNFIRQNKPQNYLLNKVYFYFMVYLQTEIKNLPMTFPLNWAYKNKLSASLRIGNLSQYLFRENVEESVINDILEFVGTPLHLYLVADYFLNKIQEDSQKPKQWDLDVNTYAIYESFLENKLKKIRFKDKNKMDIDNPDIIVTYETVRIEFIDMHKKLAAYAIFHINGQEIFNKEQLEEITTMIEKIKRGSEKTGLIYNVKNNIPQFIHVTFTEYFAVEYVSELFKREKSPEVQKQICFFILKTMLFECTCNVLNIMDQKLKIDTEFRHAVESHSNYIFNLLMVRIIDNDNGNTQIQMKSPLFEAISKNLNSFLCIFMFTLRSNVNKNNLNDFTEIIIKTEFLITAAAKKYYDLIINILELIRDIDILKWRTLLSFPRHYCDDIINNYELQQVLRQHYLNFFVQSEVSRLESFIANVEEA